MNYVKIYNSLINKALARSRTGSYYERHHILPKCLGGTDKDNIVLLTPEEHYLAHLLLVKIYPCEKGLVFAVNFMTAGPNNRRANNKSYAWIRRKLSAVMSGRIVSEETRQKIRDSTTGKPHPNSGWNKESKVKRKLNAIGEGNNRFGTKHSKKTKEQISNSISGNKHFQFNIPRTQEVKDKISLKLKGRKLSAESIVKRQATRLANKNNIGTTL